MFWWSCWLEGCPFWSAKNFLLAIVSTFLSPDFFFVTNTDYNFELFSPTSTNSIKTMRVTGFTSLYRNGLARLRSGIPRYHLQICIYLFYLFCKSKQGSPTTHWHSRRLKFAVVLCLPLKIRALNLLMVHERLMHSTTNRYSIWWPDMRHVTTLFAYQSWVLTAAQAMFTEWMFSALKNAPQPLTWCCAYCSMLSTLILSSFKLSMDQSRIEHRTSNNFLPLKKELNTRRSNIAKITREAT